MPRAKVAGLSRRDRAVLVYLAVRTGGALTYDISRAVPGGRAAGTLVALERRGLVKVNRSKYGPRISGAYITADGLEALLLSQTGITNV